METTSVRQSTVRFRVRYSETDRMDTFYNSRALEWFECGRTDLLRDAGIPYAWMESQGVFLPLVETHVNYLGRAKYDDELQIVTMAVMEGKASVRFTIRIAHVAGSEVAEGYTIHAVVGASGKPIRPPDWLVRALAGREATQ